MSVVILGLNHRTVPLDLLERVTVDDSRLPKALHEVTSRDHVSEAVVLSTLQPLRGLRGRREVPSCLRRSAQLLLRAGQRGARGIWLITCTSTTAPTPHHHLFTVAAGLDSAVVGEAEILGQVRHAWERAQGEGAAGSQLNLLFRHALEVGKRVRTETGIGRHVASVSSAAVAMAADHLGTLESRSILVMGAGDMGEGMVRSLGGQRRHRHPHRQPHLGEGRRSGRPGRGVGPSAWSTSTPRWPKWTSC